MRATPGRNENSMKMYVKCTHTLRTERQWDLRDFSCLRATTSAVRIKIGWRSDLYSPLRA